MIYGAGKVKKKTTINIRKDTLSLKVTNVTFAIGHPYGDMGFRGNMVTLRNIELNQGSTLRLVWKNKK